MRLVGLLAQNGAGWVPASVAVPLLGGDRGRGLLAAF